MTEFAIEATGVSKSYRLGEHSGVRTLSEVLSDALRGGVRGAATSEFTALDDVGFRVRAGDAVGIVGRNGAGKTTLLKILSRITSPSAGEIRVRGRLASLLEVGTGFHPELTGRENIFLNGSMLGMRAAEVRRHFDEIIAFAETERFLDTPVKRYSSGMYVRLAFAVAAHLRADILLVDEVLAVGDVQFQRKCLGKMSDVAQGGRTILFVSHNTAAVQQLTSSSLLLDKGRLIAQGPTHEILDLYTRNARAQGSTLDLASAQRPEAGTGQLRFVSGRLHGSAADVFIAGEPLRFILTVRAKAPVERYRISFTVLRFDGQPVGSGFCYVERAPSPGSDGQVHLEIKEHHLMNGRYYLNLACGIGDNRIGWRNFDSVSEVLDFEVAAPLTEDGDVTQWLSNWGAVEFQALARVGD